MNTVLSEEAVRPSLIFIDASSWIPTFVGMTDSATIGGMTDGHPQTGTLM